MAISIVSDLVLDVVKAANPERARIAQAGLQRGPAAASSAREFAEAENTVKRTTGIGRFLEMDIVGDVVNAADPSKLKTSIAKLGGTPDPAGVDMASLVLNAGDAKAVNPRGKAYQQFEASVLRNFVEGMLPKSTENVYGEGTAGNVWRSMQADFMSQELAKSGGIGIAATLAKLDEARASSQPDMSLNEIAPKAGGAGGSLSSASEWPYFSRSKIGVLES
jgi:flagellar protein FlgJ